MCSGIIDLFKNYRKGQSRLYFDDINLWASIWSPLIVLYGQLASVYLKYCLLEFRKLSMATKIRFLKIRSS